jgi:hypothetical protein
VRRGRDGGSGEQADGGSRRRRHGCPVPAAAGPALRCCRPVVAWRAIAIARAGGLRRRRERDFMTGEGTRATGRAH